MNLSKTMGNARALLLAALVSLPALAVAPQGPAPKFSLDSMAGKPIVAARAAAVPEVVRHGLLVEPESADALADAIDKLYCDSQMRASLAERGRRDVERFDIRRVARCFVETRATSPPGRRIVSSALAIFVFRQCLVPPGGLP